LENVLRQEWCLGRDKEKSFRNNMFAGKDEGTGISDRGGR